jgi:hypothetical protein
MIKKERLCFPSMNQERSAQEKEAMNYKMDASEQNGEPLSASLFPSI